MIFVNARILTAENEDFLNGFLEIKDDKIIRVGDMSAFSGEFDIDLKGKTIVPGFIDAHTHLGMIEEGISFEGDDVNEDTDPITPHLRAIDGANPRDLAFYESYSAGVTTALISQGSANPVAGQMAIIKTYGECIDDMIVSEFSSMKFALGENPKSVYSDKNQAPVTRMATVALIRENLFKAKEYLRNKENAEEGEEPEFDLKLESLIPVLKREVKAHFHCHRADDIFTAIRISKEFDLDLVLVHATESYLVAEKTKDYPKIIGPLMTNRSKPELNLARSKSPKILADSGTLVAVSTDHPETPLKYLSLQAILAIKEGVLANDALKMITINPAKILGIDEKLGSIKEGKCADFVICDGDIFDFRCKIINVYINGEVVFNA